MCVPSEALQRATAAPLDGHSLVAEGDIQEQEGRGRAQRGHEQGEGREPERFTITARLDERMEIAQ
jgi:hypothetical protein